jgi:Asp/Glu/hydantoin racemase
MMKERASHLSSATFTTPTLYKLLREKMANVALIGCTGMVVSQEFLQHSRP